MEVVTVSHATQGPWPTCPACIGTCCRMCDEEGVVAPAFAVLVLQDATDAQLRGVRSLACEAAHRHFAHESDLALVAAIDAESKRREEDPLTPRQRHILRRLQAAAQEVTYFSLRDARSNAHGEDLDRAMKWAARCYGDARKAGLTPEAMAKAMHEGRKAAREELGFDSTVAA